MEIDRAVLSPAQDRLAEPSRPGVAGGQASRRACRRVVFVAWRDLASPQAGGSEVLVDRLAEGITARGDHVTLLCGGPAAAHDYDVVRSGGPYSQFLRAPLAYWRRRVRDCRRGGRGLQRDAVPQRRCGAAPADLPRQPHAHASCGRCGSRPRYRSGGPVRGEQADALGAPRNNLFLTVSNSTAGPCRPLGVSREPHPADLQRGGAAGPADAPFGRADVPGARPADRVQAHRPAAEALEPGPPGRRRHAGHRRRRPRAGQDRGPGRPRRHRSPAG